MKIEEHLSASLVVALKSLYGATIEEKQIQLQKTRPEFEGHLTLVVFPFLRLSHKKPEETALEIGNWLVENDDAIEKFNVINGYLNLCITPQIWVNMLEKKHSDEPYGITKATETSPIVMIE